MENDSYVMLLAIESFFKVKAPLFRIMIVDGFGDGPYDIVLECNKRAYIHQQSEDEKLSYEQWSLAATRYAIYLFCEEVFK